MLLWVIFGAFLVRPQPALPSHVDQPKNTAVCIEKYCYSLFWTAKRFQGANKMCEKLGGHLMTVRSTVAADAISQMMGADGSRSPALWIGLQLSQGCTDPGKRLRGFQWVTGDEQSDYSSWSGNGTTCEPRCVAVLRDQSWDETDCGAKAEGFLCEFSFAATCGPVTAPPADAVSYSTAFGVDSGDFLALPPGSRALIPSLGLELTCSDMRPGDPRWVREAAGAWDCRVEQGGCQHACGDSGCSCPAGQRLGADGRSCSPPPGPCDSSPCQHVCFPHRGDFLCMCREGFQLEADGRTCRDVDDCALAPSVCEQGCVNLPGAFRCHCFPGYEEVDGKCEDVDECAQLSFEAPCEHECRNTPGGYECLCDAAYVLDPARPGKCKLFCNASECPAVCNHHFSGPDCECPDGFVIDDADGTDPICVDIDDCDSATCDYECLNLPGSYECVCPPGQLLQADKTSCRPEGYEGSGATDEPEDSTARAPATTAAPPAMDSFSLGILLGVVVGMLLMIFLIALVHCLLKKHYAARRALDYKCHSTEKEVVLQKVTSDCANSTVQPTVTIK
uniref:Thrombomodulin n=1 Tax=Geotrypetes seraphini TaxID=260995 RepID=A0A6P8R901_GEOSA|nr:thrombomodulin [Geotrypetes seraphini]